MFGDKCKYAVEMINITKIFGKIIVNNNINLKIKKGEVHALIGENGAGKSTLMNILFGLCKPTSGKIYIDGKLEYINNPMKAYKLGIGMVHQRFKLVNIFTVLDNITLGYERTKWSIFVNRKREIEEINKILLMYNLRIDFNAKISDISVKTQQQVEILKILYRRANIFVFDEPTAVLSPSEIDSLLKIIIDLKKSGKTIIFISHKLDEIRKIADSVSVIRSGKIIDTFDITNKTNEQISEMMVGKELVKIKNNKKKSRSKILLKIENLTLNNSENTKIMDLDNFSVNVHSGEILAVAGIEDSGQLALINAITGLRNIFHGKIIINGVNVTKMSIMKRYQLGMSYIPEDIYKYGLIIDFNSINNMVLQNINERPFSNLWLLNKSAIKLYAQDIIIKYNIVGTNSGFAFVKNLSGGNQQKLVIGRELTRNHNVLVVVQPTRGLDIGAIEYVHSKIIEEKRKGNAVLLVSYELDEIISLADRVIVLHNGKLVANLLINDVKRKEIGLMMSGVWHDNNQSS